MTDIFDKIDEELFQYAQKLVKKYKIDANIGYTGTMNPLYYSRQGGFKGITFNLEVSE